MQHNLVFVRPATIQDEGAVHMSVGAHDEADPNMQLILLSFNQWVGREQCFRRPNFATSRQIQRRRDW
jgi:hypothetical protein